MRQWSGELDHNQSHHHCLHHPLCQRLQNRKTLSEDIIHECIRDHLKSRLHVFNPHNAWQWSGELGSLEIQYKIRSGTYLGSRRCYFVKLKHLHRPHHQLIIHLPHPHCKGKSTEWERQAAIDDGGVRIEGAGALRRLMTSTMSKVRQNQLTTLVQDLPTMCASIYHQFSNQKGGTYDRKVDAITQDQMDDRGIILTTVGNAHPTTGGIVAMMGGIYSMPGSITPMTC